MMQKVFTTQGEVGVDMMMEEGSLGGVMVRVLTSEWHSCGFECRLVTLLDSWLGRLSVFS